MNHPETEPEVCAHLLKKGIPVCRFVENRQGNVISVDENGRRFHVQPFIEGTVYDYHQAPRWLMGESARMLAKIHSNMRILEHFPPYKFEADRFTCTNTYGDFMITQLICGENDIRSVIDWMTACVHPVAWEIIRSYVYSSPLCVNGEIDIPDFLGYVQAYLEEGGTQFL